MLMFYAKLRVASILCHWRGLYAAIRGMKTEIIWQMLAEELVCSNLHAPFSLVLSDFQTYEAGCKLSAKRRSVSWPREKAARSELESAAGNVSYVTSCFLSSGDKVKLKLSVCLFKHYTM
jgi:hypothetical protein